MASVRLFKDFTSSELGFISDYLEIKNYPAETIIFREGETGSEFFVIISGEVQVFKEGEKKKEHILANLKTGACFGEMSLIDSLPRSASVESIIETKVAILSQNSFLQLRFNNPEVYSQILLNMVKEFSSRLRNMDNKFVKMIGFFF